MDRNHHQRPAKPTVPSAPREVAPSLPAPERAEFLNIDLDIRAKGSLAPLAEAWPWAQRPRKVDGRLNSRWLILTPRGNPQSAEAAARMLLKHVAALSPQARRCWNQASTRTFDVGIQAGLSPAAFEGVALSPETLRRIASIGARLQVTVYARQQP